PIWNGRWVGSETRDENGNLLSSTKLITNEDGQILSGQYFNESGVKTGSWENVFKDGKIESFVYKDSNGMILTKRTMTYNSNEDVQELKDYQSGSDVKSWLYKYEYDDNKNWIKATVYYDKEDSLGHVVERSINYF